LSLPAGLVNNLPVGFQLLGPQFSEEKLFQAAYQYYQSLSGDYEDTK